MLDQIDDGYGSIDMSIEMQKLLKNLLEHARTTRNDAKGKLTLGLSFSVEQNGVTNVSYEVSCKTPKRKTGKSTMWVTKGGNLAVENPRQQKLPLREVDRAVRYAEVSNDGKPAVKDV